MRAWDFKTTIGPPKEAVRRHPVIVAPAMNTLMWDHPFTSKQLKVVVDELGYIVIDPISKQLICKDVGIGAMAEVETIFQKVQSKALEILHFIKESEEPKDKPAMVEEKLAVQD